MSLPKHLVVEHILPLLNDIDIAIEFKLNRRKLKISEAHKALLEACMMQKRNITVDAENFTLYQYWSAENIFIRYSFFRSCRCFSMVTNNTHTIWLY